MMISCFRFRAKQARIRVVLVCFAHCVIQWVRTGGMIFQVHNPAAGFSLD